MIVLLGGENRDPVDLTRIAPSLNRLAVASTTASGAPSGGLLSAGETLPTLREHLQKAQDIVKEMRGTTTTQ